MTDNPPLLGFGLPVSDGWATPGTMRPARRRARLRGALDLSASPSEPVSVSRLARCPTRSWRSPTSPRTPRADRTRHRHPVRAGHATRRARQGDNDPRHGVRGPVVRRLGIGWLSEEYTGAGVPFARRSHGGVPALPAGTVDAGSGRVLHRPSLARASSARSATASGTAVRPHRRGGTTAGRPARQAWIDSQPEGFRTHASDQCPLVGFACAVCFELPELAAHLGQQPAPMATGKRLDRSDPASACVSHDRSRGDAERLRYLSGGQQRLGGSDHELTVDPD